jgi:hypothetical protein
MNNPQAVNDEPEAADLKDKTSPAQIIVFSFSLIGYITRAGKIVMSYE